MRKWTKVFFGSAIVLPIIYLVVFIVVFWTVFFDLRAIEDADLEYLFRSLFVAHTIMMLWLLGLIIIYITHLFKTKRISTEKKPLWAAMLVFGHLFVMPVYWYFYIWRDGDSSTVAGSPERGNTSPSAPSAE